MLIDDRDSSPDSHGFSHPDLEWVTIHNRWQAARVRTYKMQLITHSVKSSSLFLLPMPNVEQPVMDEETALLSNAIGKRKQTPLPKLQITILLILQFCEPITSFSIYPYVNQVQFK